MLFSLAQDERGYAVYLHRIIVVFLISMFLLPIMSAQAVGSEATNCLVISNARRPSPDTLQFTLRNNCQKAVTAYYVEFLVTSADGKTTRTPGRSHDFFPSLMYPPSSSGGTFGVLEPGASRTSPEWGLTSNGSAAQPAGVTPSISAIIFNDGSAVGDDVQIDERFQARRYELEELRFWRDRFAKAKSSIIAKRKLSELFSGVDLDERRRSAADPRKKSQITASAGSVEYYSQDFQRKLDLGQTSIEQAVAWIGEYLDQRVAAGEKHKERRR